jgi:hypothetical protein
MTISEEVVIDTHFVGLYMATIILNVPWEIFLVTHWSTRSSTAFPTE